MCLARLPNKRFLPVDQSNNILPEVRSYDFHRWSVFTLANSDRRHIKDKRFGGRCYWQDCILRLSAFLFNANYQLGGFGSETTRDCRFKTVVLAKRCCKRSVIYENCRARFEDTADYQRNIIGADLKLLRVNAGDLRRRRNYEEKFGIRDISVLID